MTTQQLALFPEYAPQNNTDNLPILVSQKWDFPLQRYETKYGNLYSVIDWIAGVSNSDQFRATDTWRKITSKITDLKTVRLFVMLYLDIHGNETQSDFVNDKCLYRISQELRSTKARPAIEAIKQYLAEAGAFADMLRLNDSRELSTQERKIHHAIDLHEKWGLGDRPEIIHLKTQADNLATFAIFKDVIHTLVDNPNWAEIFNAEYIELFGMKAKEIATLTGGKSARDKLPTLQLDTVVYAEKRLIEILRLQQQGLSNERVLDAIVIAVRPMGVYLRDLCEAIGRHHVTGQPLLSATNYNI
jgi:hypothetical protein